ncbi:hypothetical protein CLHUN_14970 [Ruminiclostridium hungatei]|uniref:TIR domain-containing protein n=1 Tax=Ruminiclostridium hungatei TaxID=48256 RepID=A0A1V4SL17_RUMHU|nr:toll/interleukin-1 receptor domain-containing protein [Ruminiclostridium hungatei]OPX44504.1 hypothetical protein CLHUN_14970 [Ruminiclostridium hungatei]
MKVFISWSGERSREVGELLDEWLQCVLQAIEPWMSSKDIDRGSLWFSEITDQLKDTTIGIICLTQENINKPWILFEAGALAKGLTSNRVCTLLIDLQATDIIDPLAQFNHTTPDKAGIWNLVKTLNSTLAGNALREKILEQVFETYWPQFDKQFNEIIKKVQATDIPRKRTNDDMLVELLSIIRGLDRRIRNMETGGINNTRLEEETVKVTSDTNINKYPKYIIASSVKAGLPDSFIVNQMKNYGLAPDVIRSRIDEIKKELNTK